MIWLGTERGYLSDWVTQQWVRVTGRRCELSAVPWLMGPTGSTTGIGANFFEEYAIRSGWTLEPANGPRGLVTNFRSMSSAQIHPAVVAFYEETSEYQMDCWSEWATLYRPFGGVLAAVFSRRLQQLNVPLTGLDTHRGITSRVVRMRTPEGEWQIAWVRQLVASQDTLYAGSYGKCRVPGYDGECVKVCFPLPNGRAIVIMRPEVGADGTLTLISDGVRFGDPGFYFVVEGRGGVWGRYVSSMKESIHVYPAESATVRADHTLRIWGQVFLRLHYRLVRKAQG